jgi:hypothetical protein
MRISNRSIFGAICNTSSKVSVHIYGIYGTIYGLHGYVNNGAIPSFAPDGSPGGRCQADSRRAYGRPTRDASPEAQRSASRQTGGRQWPGQAENKPRRRYSFRPPINPASAGSAGAPKASTVHAGLRSSRLVHSATTGAIVRSPRN